MPSRVINLPSCNVQVIILHMPIQPAFAERSLFRTPELSPEELEVVSRIEELRAAFRYQVVQTPRRWTGSLRRVMFARAIQGSNTIEGYHVTLADAMAVAEGEEPLDAAEETVRAVAGYRNAMTYVLQLAGSPHLRYSEGLLSSLHFMMLNYDMSKGPGLLRTGPVFVQREPSGRIVPDVPRARTAGDPRNAGGRSRAARPRSVGTRAGRCRGRAPGAGRRA